MKSSLRYRCFRFSRFSSHGSHFFIATALMLGYSVVCPEAAFAGCQNARMIGVVGRVVFETIKMLFTLAHADSLTSWQAHTAFLRA